MNKKQKTTPEQKPFDYNAKIMSLTKVKIVSINKYLYDTIGIMQHENDILKERNKKLSKYIDEINSKYQKEIDLFKETNNRLHGTLGQCEIELKKSLKEQLFLMQERIKLITQNTQNIESNTMFIKKIIFLNNRNIFQRIFNVQYNKHG